MRPELFNAKNVVVQGITGTHGRFHTKTMIAAGTNIIAGVTPGKTGEVVEGVLVYDSLKAVQAISNIDISIIFVPAKFAKAALIEAIDAEVPLIICITEGIPVHDMLYVSQHLKTGKSVLIGPNCPGVLLPGVNKLGIIPSSLGLSGKVGVVSRSGTLTYEVVAGLTARGIGQKYVIGIGGDPVRGTSFVDCLELFQNDPGVERIVMVGEIGGNDEQKAAEYISKNVSKSVFGYIAGQHAPMGIQLGHAGAILGSKDESAAAKSALLAQAGVTMATSTSELIEKMV